jgi:hypothetical protein
VQTPERRKVAALHENKRVQLFGGFVFVARVSSLKNALSGPPRYPEERPIPLIAATRPAQLAPQATSWPKETPMNHAQGTFTVDIHPLSPAPAEGIGRFSINKTIHGDLEATTKGEMFTGGDPKQGAAGYVAIEHVTGMLNGKHGSFALQHFATMDGNGPSMQVIAVPGSGAGELNGIEGTFTIRVEDGHHIYEFDYALPA